MTTTTDPSTARSVAVRFPLLQFGLSLSAFLAISYVLCLLLGLIWPDGGMHRPFLQFLPGFTWLTWPSFLLGLVETVVYGWYIALVFGSLFNALAALRR